MTFLGIYIFHWIQGCRPLKQSILTVLFVWAPSKVHCEQPGEFLFDRFVLNENCDDGEWQCFSPSWCHYRSSMIGSIFWAHELFCSNREQLYKKVVDGVIRHALPATTPIPNIKKVPFEALKVAGDGRCGWRALLAATDPLAFRNVPRSILSALVANFLFTSFHLGF